MGLLLGVCLALAAQVPAAASVFVPGTHFTLSWMHSIEKVRWEEDYVVRAPVAGQALRLDAVEARVHGSAAGMEPPPDAVLRNGWYAYTPSIPFTDRLPLTRSERLDEQADLFAETTEFAPPPEARERISYERRAAGRPALPKDLPRTRIEYELDEAERAQFACVTRIGEEICETLEYTAARLTVIEHARGKYRCEDAAGAATIRVR